MPQAPPWRVLSDGLLMLTVVEVYCMLLVLHLLRKQAVVMEEQYMQYFVFCFGEMYHFIWNFQLHYIFWFVHSKCCHWSPNALLKSLALSTHFRFIIPQFTNKLKVSVPTRAALPFLLQAVLLSCYCLNIFTPKGWDNVLLEMSTAYRWVVNLPLSLVLHSGIKWSWIQVCEKVHQLCGNKG